MMSKKGMLNCCVFTAFLILEPNAGCTPEFWESKKVVSHLKESFFERTLVWGTLDSLKKYHESDELDWDAEVIDSAQLKPSKDSGVYLFTSYSQGINVWTYFITAIHEGRKYQLRLSEIVNKCSSNEPKLGDSVPVLFCNKTEMPCEIFTQYFDYKGWKIEKNSDSKKPYRLMRN